MKNIWVCKIGDVDGRYVPDGGDLPMRSAVQHAYFKLTGQQPVFIFSGWAGKLTESERKVVDAK